MGRIFTTAALVLAASVTTGCYPCMQSSYYDPCAGVVYGPSVNPPTLLSGLKKNRHEKHSCPLCTSDSAPVSCAGSGAGTYVGAGAHAGCCDLGYGAAFGQPVSGQRRLSTGCQCQSPQKCSGGCLRGKRSCSCHQKSQSGCQCAIPMADCQLCDPCPVTHCDTCPPGGEEWSSIGESYPVVGDSYPGVVYDDSFSADSFPSESYSSEPMILPGETVMQGDMVLPESFSSGGDCPHCQSTNGPIFDGTIIPEHEVDNAAGPTPAPAAEPAPESSPGETVVPEPDPLPATSMLMPTFPAPKPARQVHWVPNTLK